MSALRGSVGAGLRVPLSASAVLRYSLIRSFLRELLPVESIVEVGCGRGALACRITSMTDAYLGFEPDEASYSSASSAVADLPNAEVVNRALDREGGRSHSLLVAFEVLEHIEDDVGAMYMWGTWVRSGGHVLISVPAHQSRFGPWDEMVGHFRRYERGDLEKIGRRAGLEVVQILSYGWPLGNALEWLRNRLAGSEAAGSMADRTSASGRRLQPPAFLGAVLSVGVAPFASLQRLGFEGDRGHGFLALYRVP